MKGKLTRLTGLNSIRLNWVGWFGLLSSTIVLSQSDGGFWRFDSIRGINHIPSEKKKTSKIFQINFALPEESEKPLVVMKLAEKLITRHNSIAIHGSLSGQKSGMRLKQFASSIKRKLLWKFKIDNSAVGLWECWSKYRLLMALEKNLPSLER